MSSRKRISKPLTSPVAVVRRRKEGEGKEKENTFAYGLGVGGESLHSVLVNLSVRLAHPDMGAGDEDVED